MLYITFNHAAAGDIDGSPHPLPSGLAPFDSFVEPYMMFPVQFRARPDRPGGHGRRHRVVLDLPAHAQAEATPLEVGALALRVAPAAPKAWSIWRGQGPNWVWMGVVSGQGWRMIPRRALWPFQVHRERGRRSGTRRVRRECDAWRGRTLGGAARFFP